MSEANLNNYFLSKKTPYVKPLYSVDLSKDNEVLDWFREMVHSLGEYFRPLFKEQRENLALYLGSGIQPNFATPYAATFATTSDIYAEPQQVYINQLYRVVQDQVTLVTSQELIPDVLPNSEDYNDKVACTVVKDWLDSIHYDLDTKMWEVRWNIQKKIFGECYVIVMWNPNKGTFHPLAKKYIDEDLDLVDEGGKPITDLGGIPKKVRKNLRIGDIEYINPLPWDLFIDPQIKFSDSNWFAWREDVDVEYLKKEYPGYNWEDATLANHYFDPFTNTEKDNPHRRTVYYAYHRSHKFMPEGRFIVCTNEHMLVNEPMSLPSLLEDELLPLVRWMDIDMGVGNRGVPILFRNTKSINEAYNRVDNQIMNNLEMESPKMFVHVTSGVDPQRLPNGSIAIEWMGQHKPTIETPQTNTSSIFNFKESLKKDLDEVTLQTPMVRGDTPNAQLDSFVAFQYFEDLRNQLASPDIKGHIRAMEQLFRLEIMIANDKYDPEDGRLIKILGKHNTYQLKYFNPINLGKVYDVKIHTTGNLANSKAARVQTMLSIKREFPNMISDEVFIDAVGLTSSKKFMNSITSAVTSAEAENQSMMEGEPVQPPARYEDLIAHWETHRIPMQTLDFKHAPIEIQDLFIGHLAATEKLMFEQAAENPVFAARLETLRQFPLLYTPRPVNEPTPGPVGGEIPPADVSADAVPNEPNEPTQQLDAI